MTMRWHGEKIETILEQSVLEALRDGGEHILTEATDKCPIETGTLRRSGTVTVGAEPPNPGNIYEAAKPVDEGGQEKSHKNAFSGKQGGERAAYIAYCTPYALKQHEEDLQHSEGEKKWLEKTVGQEEGKVQTLIKSAVATAINRIP